MTDRFVCSTASSDRGEGVVATASQVRAWLLVEVHGAWGADAVEDSHLGVHVPDGWKHALKLRGIRPVCIRPPVRGPEPDLVRVFFVVAARPGRNAGRIWRRTVPLAAVKYLTEDLRTDREPEGWERHDDRIVLVCTNGKHDQCCANRGRPVVRHLRATRWAEEVWECSHIGGDRFAANLVVLPDSLYFGRMEPAEAEEILDTHADGRIALDWYRGRSTHRFAEQAAESAIRRAFDVRGVDDLALADDRSAGAVRAEVLGVGRIDAVVERSTTTVDEPLTCRGSAPQRVPRYEVTRLDGPDRS
ncbi:MAG: sucrase ferredoxin [Acidimicrobiales bacterium]